MDESEKQVIYLTTSRDFVTNRDTSTLLDNIYEYYKTFYKKSTVPVDNIFDKFVFKILSGTNANSPASILEKL